MLRIPFVARRAKPRTPLLPVVNDFHARKNRMGRDVLRAYRDAPDHPGRGSERVALARIDSSLAETRLGHANEPKFMINAVRIYFPGDGWETFIASPPSEVPSRPDPPGSKARYVASLFDDSTRSTVAILGDASITLQGGAADVAAAQIDAAFDPDSLRGARRLAELTRFYPGRGLTASVLDPLRARPTAEVIRSRR